MNTPATPRCAYCLEPITQEENDANDGFCAEDAAWIIPLLAEIDAEDDAAFDAEVDAHTAWLAHLREEALRPEYV